MGSRGACAAPGTPVNSASSVRIFDVFVDGVAHESKVGYKTLSEVEPQLRSDAYLLKTGQLEATHWHFFASPQTNKVGANSELLDRLDEAGIRCTIHLPA